MRKQKKIPSSYNTSKSSLQDIKKTEENDPWANKDEWDVRWAKRWGDSPESIPDLPEEENTKETWPFPINPQKGLICALPFLAGIGFILFSTIWLILNAVRPALFENRTYWIIICSLLLLSGILLLIAGIIGIRSYLRFFRYLEKIGSRTSAFLSDLLLPERNDSAKEIRDLKKYIRNEWFRQAHLDEEEKILYLTDEAYASREKA